MINKVGDAAADLIQLSFLRLLEARSRVRADANFRAYLLGIARNVLYEHYRRARKDLAHLELGSHSVADLTRTPMSRLAHEQDAQRLLGALRRIPLECQIVLELYYWEDMRSREVAELLELPEGTTRSRIRRAKQLLAQQLAALAEPAGPASVVDLEQWAARIKAAASDPR